MAKVVAMTASPISEVAKIAASRGCHPLLDMPVDVLDDDDGVVDEEPDRERQGEHRHIVEGEPEGPDQGKGGDDRDRQGHRTDQCRPDVPEEDENGEDREQPPEDQVLLHLCDGPFDEGGLVDGDVQGHPRRERLVNLRYFLFDQVDDGHGVRPGLFLDPHPHGGDSVEADDGASLLHPVLRLPDVPETDGGALVIGDDQIIEVGNVEEFTLDLDRVLLGDALDPAAGEFDVLSLEGDHDIVRGEPVGPELASVEPDADLPQLEAAQLDIADAVDPLELLLQDLIDIGGKLPDRFLTRKVQPHNRRRIRIDLGDPGFVDVLGKLVSDQGDLFPDILDGEVNIPLEDELHRDPGVPLGAARSDGLHAVDRVDRPFDLVRNIDVDDLGACPLQVGGDGHDRKIDLGKEINADLRITDRTENHQGHDDHGGENRPLDRGISEPH